MRRTGARLGLPAAMGKQPQLEPLDFEETNSASLAKAERELKRLKLENQKLKTDLTDIRSLYNQLIKENSHEKFDERRVTVLKSQIIQLERQVLLLSDALSSRGEVLMEAENGIVWLADKCRSYIRLDVRGAQVPVDRSDLTLMVETAESARIKLYKQVQNKTTENLSRQLKFYNEFIHPSRENDVTILDVASGQLDHLNLKHVAKLESKLSSLYKELIHLHGIMEQETSNESAYLWTSGHVTLVARERLMTRLLKSCAVMKDCSSDLLDLSLLFPSAPWPPLRKSALKEVTPDRVLKSLPSFPRSKSENAQNLVEALVKAYNHKVYMLSTQNHTLREEVKYHQKVYNLQLKYTESLFQAIREGYASFEEMNNEVIVKPLKEILKCYLELSQTASEVSLKQFLSSFKQHAPQLSDIVETIAVPDFEESDGSKVLSQYGEEFFQALEKLVKDQQTKRDREANQSDDLRLEQEKLDQELRHILEEQENRQRDLSLASSVCEHINEASSSQNESSISNSEKANRTESRQKFRADSSSPVDRINTSRNNKKSETARSEFGKETAGSITNRTKAETPPLKLSPKPAKKKSSNKVLHPKEWVDIVDVERSLSSLSVTDEKTVEEMSDKELLDYYKHGDIRVTEVLQSPHTNLPNHADDNAEMLLQSLNKPPVKMKAKKKLGYVPNTFVPNRTLQLRRSGSLTRLSSAEEKNGNKSEDESFERQISMANQENPSKGSARQKANRSSSRDNSGSKLPQKSKPAFR